MRWCLGILVFCYPSSSQGVAPSASPSPDVLCKMQILELHILPTDSDSGDGPQQSVLTNSLGDSNLCQHVRLMHYGLCSQLGTPTLQRFQIISILISLGSKPNTLPDKFIKLL